VAKADARARHGARLAAEEGAAAAEGAAAEAAAAGGGDEDTQLQLQRQVAAMPPARVLAPWQLAKLLGELDGGTRRTGDGEEDAYEAGGQAGEAAAGGGGGGGALLSPPEVVAVVGKGHVGGIVYALHRMCESFAARVIAQRCALEQARRAQEAEEAPAAAAIETEA